MSLWDRLAGKGRLARARSAELRGDLEQATTLFVEAGRLDEAARVLILRGDAEADPAQRRRWYVQAAATAPEGSDASTRARRKQAELVLATASDQPLTGVLRHELLAAARELEALGDAERAAEAFARAGDVEGEARALARAGSVERLDALLSEQERREREARDRRKDEGQLELLIASGQRREALALARRSRDPRLLERLPELEERRVRGAVVVFHLIDSERRVVLGDEVTIGRVATLSIASGAVSRHHLVVARRAGQIVVRDAGSRNGTSLRGLALVGEVPVGEGLDLRLGNEVPLKVLPDGESGGVVLELAGARYVAPLGPARLGLADWRLERGKDDWVELVTSGAHPAYAGALALGTCVPLLAGDRFATSRGASPALRIEGAP